MYWETIFLTYVVGTQKNRLNKTILLSNQNTCLNCWVRKYLQFYANKISLSGSIDILQKPPLNSHTDVFIGVKDEPSSTDYMYIKTLCMRTPKALARVCK